jgi:DNA-binding transcriptional regulator YhcF (GntR family)
MLTFASLPQTPKVRPATARSRVVATLREEILSNPRTTSFLIASEHQLCRRFGVSRVTVRLALGDLENRGLIFRKHGKGTFAHGNSTRVHRRIAVLIKSRESVKSKLVIEIVRGAFTAITTRGSSLALIGTPPQEWQPEIVSNLGGVIVMQQNVTIQDLENLNNRNLPFLIVGEEKNKLPGPCILWGQNEKGNLNQWLPGNNNEPIRPEFEHDFFTAGKLAVEALIQAGLTGRPVRDIIMEEECTFSVLHLERK